MALLRETNESVLILILLFENTKLPISKSGKPFQRMSKKRS